MSSNMQLPIPYPDELLHSVLCRYHLRVNNTSPKWTLTERYGTHNVIPTLDLPSHLDALAERSKLQGISAEKWIDRHTFLPYYAPFLPIERVSRIRQLMKGSDGTGIHTLAGITACSIDRISDLRFCPNCYEENIQQYGEPYWHRIHQLPGVYFCPRHATILYRLTSTVSDRHGLTHLPISKLLFRSDPVIDSISDKLVRQLVELSQDIQFLISLDNDKYGALYELKPLIFPALIEKGFITAGKRIRQQKLKEQLITFYSIELLKLLESNPLHDYSWLEQAARKARRGLHPLRSLLLIRFLYGSFQAFMERRKSIAEPFGTTPWPCLNKVEDHYQEAVVTQCRITRCSDTGRPVGTFTCSCGFSYSRRGPDRSEQDRFHRGRIKAYGSIWASKLNECLKAGLSYRSTAKILGVDPKTVIKYAHCEIDAQLAFVATNAKPMKVNSSPSSAVKSNQAKLRVDWKQRDLELSKEVAAVCQSIIHDRAAKPLRITIALIGKRVGRLSWLEKKAFKLPVTMAILSQYVESVEQFQQRRVRWAAEQMTGEWPLKRWKLERLAGLPSTYALEVAEEIERCITQNISKFN